MTTTKQNPPGLTAGSTEKLLGEQPDTTLNYSTPDISRQQAGRIWRNAERKYRVKLARKISNKKFDANSLDFFLLCNVSGPVAWATYDTINTTLTDLIKAGLLTYQRDSEEVEAVVSSVWTQMAMADYMPPTIQQWGEREQ